MNFTPTQINEVLDQIVAQSTRDEQRACAAEHFKKDQTFFHFMRMAFDPAFKIQGVRSGFPTDYKPETDLPDGMGEKNLRTEFRRVSGFVRGAYKGLTDEKREVLWIQILEGLHWKEAQILTMIKDQNLQIAYPTIESILQPFGIIPVAPTE